jgi:hypothetical protein
MATPIVQDQTARRVSKAAGIITRQECIPVDNLAGWFQVRDSVSGSGEWHLATVDRCDCRDALKHTCKHQMAVRAEEAALRQFGGFCLTPRNGAFELIAVKRFSLLPKRRTQHRHGGVSRYRP